MIEKKHSSFKYYTLLKYTFGLFICFILNSFSYSLSAQSNNLVNILTHHEIEWLKTNANSIRYAPLPNWPPGDYIEKGIHKGITADYIKLIEEYLGVNFQRVYFDSWSQILNGLKSSDVDFVGAIQKTDEREEFLDFTDFYLEVPLVILVRNDFSKEITENTLSKLTLAGPANYSSTDYIRNKYPDIKIVECNTDLSALIKTSLGETDATVIDLFVASHLVEKYGINNLCLALELDYMWEVRMGTRKELTELNSILNKVLNVIKNEADKDLTKKWINIQKVERINLFEKNRTIFIFILTAILLFVVFSTYYSIALKKMVRKRTEELLAAEINALENEKKFRAIFENSPTGILLSSLNKKMEANQSFLDIVGYTKEELMDLDWSDITHPEDRNFSDKIFHHMIQRNQLYARFEKRYISKKGEVIWVDLSTSLQVDDKKKPKYFITTVNDITKQKQLEAELKLAKNTAELSEKKYRMLVETSPDAIVITDLKGNHLFHNRTYFTSLGFETDEEFDINGFTRVHPDDVEGVKESFKVLLQKGRNTGEYRVKNKRCEWIYRHTIATVIYDELNNPNQILTVMRDITDRKEKETIIANSLREKELLLKEIHHRVKNNLQIVSSLLYLQSLQFKDQRIIEIFTQSLNRIQSMALLHDFLYHSENLKSINFKQYANQLVSLSKNTFSKELLKLNFIVESEEIIEFNQAIYIGLIINELLSNSVKYAFTGREQGEIVIKFEKRNGNYLLQVVDNGIGLPNMDVVANSKKSGINIIRTLAEQLKGELEYFSHRGTQVNISFPANQ